MKINFVNNTTYDVKEYIKYIKDVFKSELVKKSKYTFSIIFLNNNQIKELNLKYRNIDKVTDVLSFSTLDATNNFNIDNEIGDIFISIDKALEQKEEYKHSIKREICFLAIHGYLHLIGYDHQNPIDEKKMFDLQEEILKSRGITR